METSRRGRHRRPPLAAGSSSRSDLSWVVLDRFVHRKGDGAVAEEGVLLDVDGTRSNSSSSCTGVPIAVSLRAAEPPAVSRLYIDWPEGFEPRLDEQHGPIVVAAHRHSVLLQAYVSLVKDQWPSHYFPMDYFVYTAAGSEEKKAPAWASLVLLPACFISGQVDSEMDRYFDPYQLRNQRRMCFEEIGLLCRGDEEFVVAELTYGGELCMIHHAPGQEEDMKWSFKKLRLPAGTPCLRYGSWQNDTVIPFRDSYLCWVDFYLGLLFVDVLHGGGGSSEFTNLPVLHVPLPAVLDSRRLYIDPGSSDPARRVCITDDGMIKLICIVDRGGRSVHHCYHSTFTIRVWSLIDFDKKRKWKEDCQMEQSQFLAALDSDRRLPRIIPEFPMMSMGDPDVICFRLNDHHRRLLWLVEVRMKKKVLGAIKLYVHEEEEEEEGRRRTAGEMKFPGYSFVTSQIVQFFDKHAIKSLELSNKLRRNRNQLLDRDGLNS